MSEYLSPKANRPLQVLRDGACKATIWRNDHEEHGPYFTVSLSKTYEGKDGALKDGMSFSYSELLKVSELARISYHEVQAYKAELDHNFVPDMQYVEDALGDNVPEFTP